MYMHMMYIHPAAFFFFRADRSWQAERWYTAALLLFPAALLRVDCEGPVDGLTDGPPWSHGLWKGLSPYCLLCTVRRSCLLGTLRCSSYFCFFIYFTLNFFGHTQVLSTVAVGGGYMHVSSSSYGAHSAAGDR